MSETQQRSSIKFPLVGPDTSESAALIAIVRRLSIARSLPEIMEVVTHAARTLLRADGITFVLREGENCYYAEEDAISPLWKGRRFPLDAILVYVYTCRFFGTVLGRNIYPVFSPGAGENG